MQKLQKIFKTIRDDFHAVVPPLTATIDEEHHYEVWAINDNKKTFFGRVIMHQDHIELSFYSGISKETEWTLFPGDIFKRLEEDKYYCEIKDLSPELQANITEAINNLIDYFRMHHLLA